MYSINIEAFWASLLGLWLSYSLATIGVYHTRLHWFVKFLAIFGLAALLYFIKAPDLVLVVLTQCLTIFLLLKAGDFWLDRKSASVNSSAEKTPAVLPQIRLLDVMLGMAVLGVLLTVTRVDLSDYFPLLHSILFGMLLGVVVVSAWWLAKIMRRWIGALVAVICVAGAVAIPKLIFRPPEKFTDFGEALASFFDSIDGGSFIWGELTDFLISILIANAIAIFLVGVTWRSSRSTTVGIKRTARAVGVLMIVTMVVLTAANVHLYACLLGGPQMIWPAQPPTDEINGFDELVVTAQRFQKSQLLNNPETASAQAGKPLKQELDKFSAEFRQVENALQRPVLTSALSSLDEEDARSHIYLRLIARALSCRAIQYLHEGNGDAALADACLITELGVPLRRGKLFYLEISALAYENMGSYQAVSCIDLASSESLKQAISRLSALEPDDEQIDELIKNDLAVWWHYYTWLGRLSELVGKEQELREKGMIHAIRRRNAISRQAVTLMALELFRRKENQYPADLKSLVPTFLDSVPVDPFSSASTNKPLGYERSEDGNSFELYSLGPDQIDDHGKLGRNGYIMGDDNGDLNLVAIMKYEEATTEAEREALTIPDPWEDDDIFQWDDVDD